MALPRPGNTAAKSAAPAFEQDGDTAVAEKPVSDAVKVSTTTALAEVGSRALTTGPLVPALSELEGAIPPDQAESLTRIKSGSGIVKDADGHNYGQYIDIDLVSFHPQWIASPGSDDDEAKEAVRYSYDGKTLNNSDVTLHDYVASLVAQGYNDAAVKQYTILVGIVVGSDKGGGLEGDLVQVSLSPMSKKSFESCRLQAAVKQRQGRLAEGTALDALRITAESKSGAKNRDFTLLKVTLR